MRLDSNASEGSIQLPGDLLEALTDSRAEFLAYVRSRIAEPELAEDVLQESLLRAIRAAPDLRDQDRAVAWFYRILRNAITDAYRRRDVQRRRTVSLDALEVEWPAEHSNEDERVLCECFRALLPSLRDEYAEVIEALDLRGEPSAQAAARLGITDNNLKVRRHRARRALRQRLEETCRLCARHGCLDCTCGGDPIEV